MGRPAANVFDCQQGTCQESVDIDLPCRQIETQSYTLGCRVRHSQSSRMAAVLRKWQLHYSTGRMLAWHVEVMPQNEESMHAAQSIWGLKSWSAGVVYGV